MSHLTQVARQVADLSWDDLAAESQARVRLVLLDTLGCAAAGHRLGFHRALVEAQLDAGGPPDATLWFERQRVPAAHAALVNGTVAHHAELDDGHPAASLHGGVTIVPSALAAAEVSNASGRRLLEAIAAGYGAAIACGRPMLDGITAHRLHPPAIVGCFGAAAAAARALGLNGDGTAGALSLASTLLPVAPFESFTKGAPVKDMYAGWPAFVGVTTALLARDGMHGPVDAYEAPYDGVGQLPCHGPPAPLEAPDSNAIRDTQFKAYATCRSVQPALTALEALLPLDPDSIESIDVATYPFAVELSHDADPTTAIGAKASIPYCIASCIIDGAVGHDGFAPAALADTLRRRLAERVTVRVADEMRRPLVRGARIAVRCADGRTRQHAVRATRWSASDPASEEEVIGKFRGLVGAGATGILRAVEELSQAGDVGNLSDALHGWP